MHGLPTLSHLIHHITQFNIVREAHLNGSSGYKMAKFILDICLLLSDDVEAGVVVDAKRSACQTQQSMHLLRDFTVLRRCTENEMAVHHHTTTYHSPYHSKMGSLFVWLFWPKNGKFIPDHVWSWSDAVEAVICQEELDKLSPCTCEGIFRSSSAWTVKP